MPTDVIKCIIYNVIEKPTDKIIKKGSTIQKLKKRAKQVPYNTPAYKDCCLLLDREFDWPENDKEFAILLLRVREQFEIAKAHLWLDEGGRNATEPVLLYLRGMEGSIQGIIGSQIRMLKDDWKGHLKRISHLGIEAQIADGSLSKRCRELGLIQGKRNRDTGHMKNLGKKFGPTMGVQNFLKWTNSDENKERLAKIRTSEHQQKAASIAGKVAKESGQISALGAKMKEKKLGIFSPDYDRSEQSRIQHAKKTPEQRAEHGRYMNHTQWHVRKNIINPNCLFCCPQQIEIAS